MPSRITREKLMSARRLAARRRCGPAPYMGGFGKVPESVGRGYETPHGAGAVGIVAEIRYAATLMETWSQPGGL